jgi:hypothetical protein
VEKKKKRQFGIFMASGPVIDIPFERNRFEDPFPCAYCEKKNCFTRIYINKPKVDSKWLCYNCAIDFQALDDNWKEAFIPVCIQNGF